MQVEQAAAAAWNASAETPAAKAALAGIYRQFAWRAETAPWRDFYLTGAQELEQGIRPGNGTNAAGISANLSVANLPDTLAVRVVPERAIAPMTIAPRADFPLVAP